MVAENVTLQEFDPRLLRTCLGQFATGVTVIVAQTPDGIPHGMTVNAFSAMSLDPPLVMVSLRRDSHMASLIPGQRFTVSVLHQEQREVALRFGGAPDSEAEIEWADSSHGGPPAIAGSLATFECDPYDILDGGDHLIVLGLVRGFTREEAEPLLFFGGGFPRLASVEPILSFSDYSGSPGWCGDLPLYAPAVTR